MNNPLRSFAKRFRIIRIREFLISIILAVLLTPSVVMACPTCAVGSSSESGSSLWLVFALIAAPFAIAAAAAAAIGYFFVKKHGQDTPPSRNTTHPSSHIESGLNLQ